MDCMALFAQITANLVRTVFNCGEIASRNAWLKDCLLNIHRHLAIFIKISPRWMLRSKLHGRKY